MLYLWGVGVMPFKKYTFTNTITIYGTNKQEAIDQFNIGGNDFGMLNINRYKISKIDKLTVKEINNEIIENQSMIEYLDKELDVITDPKKANDVNELIDFHEQDNVILYRQLKKLGDTS
jgi:hypothetical protein